MENCLYCGEPFKPRTASQLYCRPKCKLAARNDDTFFDGMRRTAIGFDERQCWACQKIKLKSFHVHHVVGKANDPKDPLLVVLCPGCHNLVTKLSGRLFLEDPRKVADIITLARFEKGLPNVKTTVIYEEVP